MNKITFVEIIYDIIEKLSKGINATSIINGGVGTGVPVITG